jgi:hypothetical protein
MHKKIFCEQVADTKCQKKKGIGHAGHETKFLENRGRSGLPKLNGHFYIANFAGVSNTALTH